MQMATEVYTTVVNKKKNHKKTWTCYACSCTKTFMKRSTCFQCGEHWATSRTAPGSERSAFPPALKPGPVHTFPPAGANQAAASRTTSVGHGPKASVFVDDANRTYDVGLMKTAKKTFEVLLGAKHPSIVEIEAKL